MNDRTIPDATQAGKVRVLYQDSWPFDISLEPLGITANRAAYSTSQKTLDARVMSALEPTELVAELVETLNCSLQFVERLEARSGAATETGNMLRATLAKLEASE